MVVKLLILLILVLPRVALAVEGGPLFGTTDGLILIPTQGLVRPQIVLTHATDCTVNITNARLGQVCVDLDDMREWFCNTSTCTTAGNWLLMPRPSFATHTALANPNSITATARYMGIECSTGQCDLTSNPQIVAGQCNQELTLFGSDTTGVKTVKLDNGNGIRLAGNTGSIIVGRNDSSPTFRFACDLTPNVWEQIVGVHLQGLFNENNVITVGSCGTTSALKLQDSAGTSFGELCVESGIFKIKATCSGVPCSNSDIGPLPIGGAFRVLNNAGSPIYIVNQDGTMGGPNAPVKTACLPIDAVTAADDNKLFGSVDKAITIKSVWCHYEGSAPTTVAQFQLVGMTHTPPTCVGPTTQATKQTVSAGNSVVVQTPFRWSVTNTPNPATDNYLLCVAYDAN